MASIRKHHPASGGGSEPSYAPPVRQPRARNLGELFQRADISLPEGLDSATPIEGFEDDSRAVQPGCVFMAVQGEKTDGHKYIAQALAKGAVLAIADHIPDGLDPSLLNAAPAFLKRNQKKLGALRAEAGQSVLAGKVLLVPETRYLLGRLAQAYWGMPSRVLHVIGVTGTNGKTTTVYLIEGALRKLRRYPALLSTVEYRLGGEKREAHNTTPGAVELARLMALALERDADSIIMEVSSHALAQGRVESIEFDVAAITNVTQDHLDYHHTMEEYAEAKRLLFTRYKPRVAVFNLDDPTARKFSEEYTGAKLTYSLYPDSGGDLTSGSLQISARGIDMAVRFRDRGAPGRPVCALNLHSPLRGTFNAQNLLAAAAICAALGLPAEQVVAGLNGVPGAPGRFEAVDAGQLFSVLVDYAHTPDAVERLLENVRTMTVGHVIAVLGCGGDRDAGKRPKMGAAMGRLADYSIITTDNPRGEAPEKIAAAMEEGIHTTAAPANYEIQLDRREAIHRAFLRARPGDIVVIAGKGHETYQEVEGVRHHFDDRETAREILRDILRERKDTR